MKYCVFYLGLIFGLSVSGLKANEGMWLPYLLQEGIVDSMQAQGMELDIEDIFSNDTSSLKDAVIIFGGGCTGSFISGQGLILTNHHCALSSLEKLSNDSLNITQNGYWSQSETEELHVPGLSVKLLNDVVNVTDRFELLNDGAFSEKERQNYVDSISRVIAKNHQKGPHQHVSVEGFNYDQQFYLFAYTEYNDVRLVAAPPLAIGKFGKDKDNWKWPRHTGDFSIFRVYAGPGNDASSHAEENIPFQPERHLPVSTAGVQENDFVWAYGFPGKTNEYLPSKRIQQIQENILPNSIEVRELKLNTLEEQPATSHAKNDHLSRQARLSNILKRQKGITEGLDNEDVVKIKADIESKLVNKITHTDSLLHYEGLVEEINNAYESFYPVDMANDYASQVFLGTDLMKLILRFYHKRVGDKDYMNNLQESVDKFTASTNIQVQTGLSKELLMAYYNKIDPKYHPDHFDKVYSDYNGDIQQYVNGIFEESLFSSQEDIDQLMNIWAWRVKRKLKKDPLYQLTFDMGRTYWGRIRPEHRSYTFITDSLQRHFFNLQRDALPDKHFYPDANRTIRLAYGQVEDYSPGDAIYYNWHTSVSGIVYKWESGEKAYPKDNRLAGLIRDKNYGTYFSAETPVNFISNIHTTGGNSGSPVLNGKGELVGLNFDRNWEGTMADYYYQPAICRNIMVDIRYILFLLEQYGSSDYVLNELTIH